MTVPASATLPGPGQAPVHRHRRPPISLSLHRLLHSAWVCTLTALEVAVLGTGTDLMSADPVSARGRDRDGGPPAVPVGAARHRAAVPGVRGVSGTSEAIR